MAWVLSDVRKPRKKLFVLNRLFYAAFQRSGAVCCSKEAQYFAGEAMKSFRPAALESPCDKVLFYLSSHDAVRFLSVTAFLSVYASLPISFLSQCLFNSPLSHIGSKISYTRIVPKSFFFSLVIVQALLPAWGSNRSTVQAMPAPV